MYNDDDINFDDYEISFDEDFDNIPVIEKPTIEGFLSTSNYPQVTYSDDVELPRSINWVTKGDITPVKETDYDCTVGSYAFAAADRLPTL